MSDKETYSIWESEWFVGCLSVALGILAIVLVLWVVVYGFKKYQVWGAGITGKAELERAQWNRQIAVQEAHAQKESAKELAQAEIIRAQGVAKANAIIGASLNKNEAYLRYLWIQNLRNESNQVIYVPTEGNLPILEAGKRK